MRGAGEGAALSLAVWCVLGLGCGGQVDAEPAPSPPEAIAPRWALASGDGANQLPWSVATDARGDVYVVGEFGGQLRLSEPLSATEGKVSGFVAKLGRDGSRRWARRVGDDAAAFAVATAPDGRVHVGGWFHERLAIDGFTLTSAGETDAFWLVLDADGRTLSAERFGDGGSQAVTSIAADEAGVVLAGDFDGTIDLGAGPLPSNGVLDVFVTRRSARGPGGAFEVAWARALGGPLLDRRPKVALGPDGSAYVAATYRGAPDLGLGPLPDRYDGTFLARLGPDGRTRWARGFPGTGWCYPTSLAVEGDRVALSGRFTEDVDVGRVLRSESGEDGLLAVFGDDGALRAAERYGGFGQDAVASVAWDRGALWATGEVQTTLGGVASAGSADLFVARLGSDLSLRAIARYGDAELQRGQRVAVDPLGGAVVVGAFFGALELGARLTSSGGFDDGGGDVFVASFGP